MNNKLRFFKKSDLIIIGIILVVCVVFYFAYNYFVSNSKVAAEIYYGSEFVVAVDLHTSEDRSFSIPQDEDVVFHLYSDGSICFEYSDCPDKVCIRSGRLSKAGQSAACLPNNIILKIVSLDDYNEGDADIVV